MAKRDFRRHVQALATGVLVATATGCEEPAPPPPPSQVPSWVTLPPKADDVPPIPKIGEPPAAPTEVAPPAVRAPTIRIKKVTQGFGSNSGSAE